MFGLREKLRSYGQNSRPENFESKKKRGRWAGNEKYATARMAKVEYRLDICKVTNGAYVEII
jgi:hypothetical protein